MTCALCGYKKADQVDTLYYELRDGTDFVLKPHICTRCGLVYLDPMPPKELLDKLYAEQNRLPSDTIAYKEQVEFINNCVTIRKNAVLDIGAYDGRLASELLGAGAEKVYGVEPDSSIQNVPYHRLDTLDTAWAMLAGTLDLITMGHVFEHMRDPGDVLHVCYELLKPGGRLFIEVPNLYQPQVQLVPYWTIFHLFYYTRDTLEAIVHRCGFDLVAEEQTGYRAIRMLFERHEDDREFTQWIPNAQDARDAVSLYQERRVAELARIQRVVDTFYHERKAIFGAGDHTHWLLRTFPGALHNVACFLDSHPARRESDIYGIPVLSPDSLPDDVAIVLISSYDTQNEMADVVSEISDRAVPVRLYADVRAYDVWEGK